MEANLHKISTVVHYPRHSAEQRGLNPSETVYMVSTRDLYPLRLSKTGDPTSTARTEPLGSPPISVRRSTDGGQKRNAGLPSAV